ncbi:hypothetical protein [Sphingomonas aquatilis]|uniref:hypothetical protein n=1 Tax=Sphingomonas aquatilis TaxID=93063 RepID=UPI0023F6EE0C|nr:hypothetical protein [Sphingomonas aquatilis]MCI4652598.1 hypothetical protein [Sphingomonas aquatilis]
MMRWDPYSLTADADFDSFWADRLKAGGRRLLLVLGRGFDVRTLETARRLHALGADVHVWQLAFDNGLGDSEARSAMTAENHKGLVDLFGEDRIKPVPIDIGGPSGNTATPLNTQSALQKAGDCQDFDDVIVDISAMPRMVAMTAVSVLLFRLDKLAETGGKSVNLHVTTAESVSADIGAARGSLRDGVTFVRGFSGHLEEQTTQNWPRVWFPVLGERQRDRLSLIQELLDPDEICPVIPFPTKKPRRGDEVVGEHRETLFDDFQIEPANILLASEYNPFEAYKQIYTAMDQYKRALRTMGGCKLFVSPLSSKLLSIGVLLACYDHRYGAGFDEGFDVGIPYVETAVYGDPEQGAGEFELHSMWIRGDWEEALPAGDTAAATAEPE